MSESVHSQDGSNSPHFVERLHSRASKLLYFGDTPPEGFVCATTQPQQVRDMWQTLDSYFALKIHREINFDRSRFTPGRTDSTHFDRGRLDHCWVHPDFKEQVKNFFLNNRIFPEGREHPEIYSELFLRIDKCLKAPADRDRCTLYVQKDSDAVVAHELKLDKPTMVYCGGLISISEEEGYIYRAIRRGHRVMDDLHTSEDLYQIHSLTYRNSMTISKVGYIYRYQQDPHNFHSPQADDFVTRFLRPHLVDLEGHPRPVEDIVKTFGNLRLLGYSYGTSFVGEVRNGLHQELKELGFTPEQTRKIIPSIGVLCVGSLTPIVDKSFEGDFTQVDIIDRKDKMSHGRMDFAKYDWHKTAPDLPIAYYKQGTHLALYVEDVAHAMPQVRLEMPKITTSLTDSLKPEFYTDPTTNPEFTIINNTRPNLQGHAVEAYLLGTRYRTDDNTNVVEVNAASHIGRKFMANMMIWAFKAMAGEVKPEELPQLLDRIIRVDLDPAHLRETETNRKFMLGLLQEVAKDGKRPTPTRIT